ncbi:MAG: hypothetical protein II608_08675 [Oscillospiraceae bacterium]|nr:hypothetical protein [Oscillospiraceae bacterium]
MKKLIIRQWGQIIFGLIIFSFGVHCTIFANIGLAPWDCLAMGLSYHLPLNYGMTVTLISLIIIGLDLLMKERIGRSRPFWTHWSSAIPYSSSVTLIPSR